MPQSSSPSSGRPSLWARGSGDEPGRRPVRLRPASIGGQLTRTPAQVRRHRLQRVADGVRLRQRAQPARVSAHDRSTPTWGARCRALTDPGEPACCGGSSPRPATSCGSTGSAGAYAAVQSGRTAEVKRLLLGPEIVTSTGRPRPPRASQASRAGRPPMRTRRFARPVGTRQPAALIAALVTGLFVVILLVTRTTSRRRPRAKSRIAGPATSSSAHVRPGPRRSPSR